MRYIQRIFVSKSMWRFSDPGDIVFITSDGVSDNFDPVVGKFCLIRKQYDDIKLHQAASAGNAAQLAKSKSPQPVRKNKQYLNRQMSAQTAEELLLDECKVC